MHVNITPFVKKNAIDIHSFRPFLCAAFLSTFQMPAQNPPPQRKSRYSTHWQCVKYLKTPQKDLILQEKGQAPGIMPESRG